MKAFSSGTEYMDWQEDNCMQCKKYESSSTRRADAGCALAFDLDTGAITDGEIPDQTADAIGRSNPVGLLRECAQFIDKGDDDE